MTVKIEKQLQEISDAFNPFRKNAAAAFAWLCAPMPDVEDELDERLIDPFFKSVNG
jgi:hypothetical protein